MRAIDICAGAGGLSLGLQRAGFEVLGVEHDADACEQHRRHVGPCEQADVTAWSPSASVELVAGGVPCTITANATDQTPDPQRPSRRPIANLAVILSGVSPTICAGGVGAGGGPEPIVNREQREALGDALAAAGLADRPGTSIQAHASGRLAKAGHHERQFAGSIRLEMPRQERQSSLFDVAGENA